MCPGKNKDGYFNHSDILKQADEAMDIVKEDYAGMEHVFVYDNAPLHLKCAKGSPSARHMPKFTLKVGENWFVEVTKHHPDGKPVTDNKGKYVEIKILMSDATLPSGQPQPLYFEEGHTCQGTFKGMAEILIECGYNCEKIYKLHAQCGKSFNCVPGAIDCCCFQLLYNKLDFMNAPTLLKTHYAAHGFKVIFLSKFHCVTGLLHYNDLL
ncbi:hypothetical protein C0995_014961, partial [Termitomyces sp. Mi166